MSQIVLGIAFIVGGCLMGLVIGRGELARLIACYFKLWGIDLGEKVVSFIKKAVMIATILSASAVGIVIILDAINPKR